MKFQKQIEALSYEQCIYITRTYFGMDVSITFEDPDGTDALMQDIKEVLLGNITLCSFFEEWWLEEYDGESLQDLFSLYDYLNNL